MFGYVFFVGCWLFIGFRCWVCLEVEGFGVCVCFCYDIDWCLMFDVWLVFVYLIIFVKIFSFYLWYCWIDCLCRLLNVVIFLLMNIVWLLVSFLDWIRVSGDLCKGLLKIRWVCDFFLVSWLRLFFELLFMLFDRLCLMVVYFVSSVWSWICD